MFGCKECYQSDFSVDHLVMSMCRVFSCVVGRGCLLWPVRSLGKTQNKKKELHIGMRWLKKNLSAARKFVLTLERTVEIPIADFSTRKKTIRPHRILKKITANQELYTHYSTLWSWINICKQNLREFTYQTTTKRNTEGCISDRIKVILK